MTKIKKLKYVEQLDPSGCTIACLAMIVDKKYFELRDFLNDKKQQVINCLLKENVYFPHFYKDHTSSRIHFYGQEIMNILETIFQIKSRFIEFRSMENLVNHCVLTVSDIKGCKICSSHAVLYDARKKIILDPSSHFGSRLNNNLVGHNVVTCLEILG